MRETDDKIHVAFDSPQTAARVSGGETHTIKGVLNEENAFILTDRSGRNFIYVKDSYSGYRDLANRAAGEKIADKAEDADHVGSKTVNPERYVLLARVPSAANRSAGSVEKVTTLDGQFNRSAAGQGPNGEFHLLMSARQAEKLSGKTVSDYDTRSAKNHSPLEVSEINYALMQSHDEQSRLENMKGKPISTKEAKAPDERLVEPDAVGVSGPWDRHQATRKHGSEKTNGKRK